LPAKNSITNLETTKSNGMVPVRTIVVRVPKVATFCLRAGVPNLG